MPAQPNALPPLNTTMLSEMSALMFKESGNTVPSITGYLPADALAAGAHLVFRHDVTPYAVFGGDLPADT